MINIHQKVVLVKDIPIISTKNNPHETSLSCINAIENQTSSMIGYADRMAYSLSGKIYARFMTKSIDTNPFSSYNDKAVSEKAAGC